MRFTIVSIKLIFFVAFIFPAAVYGQPATEIYVFDLNKSGDNYSIENPVNVSFQNPGYDNQPHFLPDGSLYFVKTIDGQTEVVNIELKENSWSRLTHTAQGGEYSPTPIPNMTDFSAVRLDTTGLQRLYQYRYDGSDPKVVIDNLVVGYHAWLNKNIFAAFVLGDTITLQVCDVAKKQCKIIDTEIGRSLHKIPGKDLISYISKKGESWQIIALNPITGTTSNLATTLPGIEDMAWAPDGTIFMGKDNILYKMNPYVENEYVKVADLSEYKLSGITRLAISPEGDKIAIVVNQ